MFLAFIKKQPIIIVVMLFLMVALLAKYVQYSKLILIPSANSTSTLLTALQTKVAVGQVGKLASLPQNEVPEALFIKKSARMRNQAFFAMAEDNDVVLMYKKAHKAYLYRPSTHTLINAGPMVVVAGPPPDDTMTPDGLPFPVPVVR